MFADRFQGPEYTIGEPIMPELIKFDPEQVTPEVLAELRQGNNYPLEVRGTFHDYSKLRIVNEFGKNRFVDEGVRTELVSTLTADEADRRNLKAIQFHWDSGNNGSSMIVHTGPEFRNRHLGSTNRVYIGFFERAVRKARGLSNDVWRYQAPGIQNEPIPQVVEG